MARFVKAEDPGIFDSIHVNLERVSTISVGEISKGVYGVDATLLNGEAVILFRGSRDDALQYAERVTSTVRRLR